MSWAPHREILLFEPSSLTASIIVATARQMNLPRVRQVSSVRTAHQQLTTQGFRALIMSLDEAHETVALLEQVRNDQLAVDAQVPVAVTTAQVDPGTAVKMKALQVRRVLLKPFKVRDVIATIQMLDPAIGALPNPAGPLSQRRVGDAAPPGSPP